MKTCGWFLILLLFSARLQSSIFLPRRVSSCSFCVLILPPSKQSQNGGVAGAQLQTLKPQPWVWMLLSHLAVVCRRQAWPPGASVSYFIKWSSLLLLWDIGVRREILWENLWLRKLSQCKQYRVLSQCILRSQGSWYRKGCFSHL